MATKAKLGAKAVGCMALETEDGKWVRCLQSQLF
jgi:hypothetical protein